jgi:hypothetical protein
LFVFDATFRFPSYELEILRELLSKGPKHLIDQSHSLIVINLHIFAGHFVQVSVVSTWLDLEVIASKEMMFFLILVSIYGVNLIFYAFFVVLIRDLMIILYSSSYQGFHLSPYNA